MSLCITFFTASEISETGSKWNQKPSEAERSGVHFLLVFGVMSSERFQLNLLRHLLDFNSLQAVAPRWHVMRWQTAGVCC